eukprot:PhF_6_TR31847/c0_g1_i9/m.47179
MLALGKSEIHLLNKYRPHKVRNVLIETTRLSGEKITPHTPTWYVNNLMYDPSHDVALSFWRQNQQHKTAEVHDLLPRAVDCVVIFCSLGGNRANEKDEYAFAHRQCLQCVECGVPIVWVLCTADRDLTTNPTFDSPSKFYQDIRRWFPSSYKGEKYDTVMFAFTETIVEPPSRRPSSIPKKHIDQMYGVCGAWEVDIALIMKRDNATVLYNQYCKPLRFMCKEAFEKSTVTSAQIIQYFCETYRIDAETRTRTVGKKATNVKEVIEIYREIFGWSKSIVPVLARICQNSRSKIQSQPDLFDMITSTTDGATVLSVPSSYGAPLDRCLPYITYGYHKPWAGTTSPYQVVRNVPCPHTERLPHGTIRTTEICYTILDELVPNSKVHRKEDMATPPPTSLTTKRQQSVRNKFIDLDEATVRLSTDTAPPTSTTHGRRASLIPVKSEDINPSTLFVIEDALTT